MDSQIVRERQAIQDAADLLNAKHLHADGSLAVEYKVLERMDLATRVQAYSEATILLATPIREGFSKVPFEFAVATRLCKMNGFMLVRSALKSDLHEPCIAFCIAVSYVQYNLPIFHHAFH